MNPVTEFAAPAPATRAAAPRRDLYGPIHKALRAFMGDVLLKLGRMDADRDDERALALDGLDALLALLRSHVEHENDFLHTAIEARRPGGARNTADDHVHHVDAIAQLQDEARALRLAPVAGRAAAAARLYRHVAAFVGENLVHMQIEETQNNAALWALYDDAELGRIHDRLVASIPPAEMALIARWMVAALADAELAAIYADVRSKAPAPAFEALLDVARLHLAPARWATLARALDRAPVPGLMTA